VVDYFSTLSHPPYDQAKSLEDVAPGAQVVRTLLKLGHFEKAANIFRGGLSQSLLFNLEAYDELLALIRPFFPVSWDQLPKTIDLSNAAFLVNEAAVAFSGRGEFRVALTCHAASLVSYLENEDWAALNNSLHNISSTLSNQNSLAKAFRVTMLCHELAQACDDEESLFRSRLLLFVKQLQIGELSEAADTWRQLDQMGRVWSRAVYRQGSLELDFAHYQFRQGRLREQDLTTATNLAEKDNNRRVLRDIHALRGAWRLEQSDWESAAKSFREAIRMARERRLADEVAEAGLALAKIHLCQFETLKEARLEAERLASERGPALRIIAMLWRAIGDFEQAEKYALAAYKWAWADGEPYVNRYSLIKTTELLNEMKTPIPVLPPYDPAKDEPFPWEAKVRAVIKNLHVEKRKSRTEKEAPRIARKRPCPKSKAKNRVTRKTRKPD
jgi:tetratricopeptide (TPR) repeat protein